MRDLAGCFAHQAVRVAEATCSGNATASAAEYPTQNAITCFYRTVLSTRKELLTRVVWSKNQAGASLSVMVGDASSSSNSHLLRKKKGSRSFVAGSSAVSLHWDVSAAEYGPGPEPEKDFYVVVIADGEFGLLLGDMCGEFIKKREDLLRIAEFSMASRTEQVRSGAAALCYSTRAQLGDSGKEHEIAIRCKGDDAEDSELSVAIDRKKVVCVKRLRWNFRGNQTIFVDGSTIDLMWDVHDWWFCDSASSRCCALFTFRARSTAESRLWLDEELEQGRSGFSLLIQAFKSQ